MCLSNEKKKKIQTVKNKPHIKGLTSFYQKYDKASTLKSGDKFYYTNY